MHVLDSEDSSGGLYVAGPPKTVLGRHAQNAMFQEIKNAVLRSAQDLASAGSADFSETAWIQLAQAIAEADTDGSNLIQACQWQDTNDASPTDATADFDVQYVKHSLKKIISVTIPNGAITPTAPRVALYLRKGDATALPNAWGSESGTQSFSLWVTITGTLELVKATIVGSASAYLILERVGGASFPASAVTIWGTTFTYIAEDPMD